MPSNTRTTAGRLITHADVEQIIATFESDPDQTVPLLYFDKSMSTYVRATGKVRTMAGHPTVVDVHPPGRRRPTEPRPAPIGKKVSLNVVTEFGTQWGATLFTTPEADKALGGSEVGSLHLLIEDGDGDREVPLVAVYGVSVNVSLLVQGADADPDEVAEEARTVLAEHFKDRGKDVRAKARTVPDHRVNVYSNERNPRLLAVNVLVSEAHRFADSNSHTIVPASADPVTASIARSEA